MDRVSELDVKLEPYRNWVIGGLAVVLVAILFSYVKLPSFLVGVFDNVLFKIAMICLVLYLSFNHSLSMAIGLAICLMIFMMALHKTRETMALVGESVSGIPEYTYSSCSHPGAQRPCDSTEQFTVPGWNNVRGWFNRKNDVDASGTIVSVPDADERSLCLHLKDTRPMSAEFSELVEANGACKFAKHQYQFGAPQVPCADQSQIMGSDDPFPTAMPV
jgi:hypothetical protein